MSNLIKNIKGIKLKPFQVLIILLLAIVLIKILVLVEIDHKDWEPDGYMHTLIINTIFKDFPNNIPLGIDVWAKPLYTYFFSIINLIFGDYITNIQIGNVLIVTLVSLLIYKISFKLSSSQKVSIFIAIMSSINFLVFRSSLTALTEPLFTLILVLGFYYLISNKYLISMLFIGLLPLGRMEGFLFVIIWGLLLIWLTFKKTLNLKGFIKGILLLALPAIVWNFLGFLKSGSILFIVNNGYPNTPGVYGFGGWIDYFHGFLIQEPVALFLIIFGIIVIGLKVYTRKIKLFEIILFTSIYSYLIINIVFWRYGIFGTAGLMRYFIPIIPLIHLLSSYLLTSNYIKRLGNKYLLFTVIILQLIFTLGSMYLYKGFFMGLLNYPSQSQNVINVERQLKNISNCKIIGAYPSDIYYSGRNLANSEQYFDRNMIIDESKKGDYIFLANEDWIRKQKIEIKNSNYTEKQLFSSREIIIYYFDDISDPSSCNNLPVIKK